MHTNYNGQPWVSLAWSGYARLAMGGRGRGLTDQAQTAAGHQGERSRSTNEAVSTLAATILLICK